MGQIKNIKLHIVTDIKLYLVKAITVQSRQNGEHSKNEKNVLQRNQMPQTHPTQGDSVQSCKEANFCQRTKTLRTETVRFWWSDSTHSSQESKDYKEDCVENGVQ